MVYYYSYKRYIQDRFPDRPPIRKVSIDAGFTCPNIDGTKGKGGCIYCNNEAFTPGKIEKGLSVGDQIARQIPLLEKRYKVSHFLAYFQSYTNTYTDDIGYLRQLYIAACEHPQVVGISVATRPDCLSSAVIELFEELAEKFLVNLEVGLQTSNDQTLHRINRGHTFQDFSDALKRCQGKPFEIATHLILGLPGETAEDWKNTAIACAATEIDTLKITSLYVARRTVLEKMYQKGDYQALCQERYVQGVVDVLELMAPQIGIQRVTGSAPASLMIAPNWCRDREKTVAMIHSEFQKRESFQGKLYQSSKERN